MRLELQRERGQTAALRIGRSRRPAVRGALLAAALVGVVAADSTESQLRLAGTMHRNLAALNACIEGVALEDQGLIEGAGKELRETANLLKEFGAAAIGVEPGRSEEFNRLLDAQVRSAEAIVSAGRQGDVHATLAGSQRMLETACIRCHDRFRSSYPERTSPVLFMRMLLSSTHAMNWGLAMDDFSVIAREAREIATIARIFNFSRVAELLFEVEEPAARQEFRSYVNLLVDEANRLEGAAFTRDTAEISRAYRRMLVDGCVPCHQRFRREEAFGAPSGEPR